MIHVKQILDTWVQRVAVLNAPSRFPASVQAATMSDQKHDVHHCMVVTGQIRLPDNDMLIEACQHLEQFWHQTVMQSHSKIAGKRHHSICGKSSVLRHVLGLNAATCHQPKQHATESKFYLPTRSRR